MIEKIKVTAGVSSESKSETIDLMDLGFTKDRWDLLDIDEQREILQEYFDNHPDQPYWVVEKFN